MLQHPPRDARSLSVHLTRRFATVAAAACLAAGSAHAQAPFAFQAPLPYAAPQADLVDPTKNIYHWNGFAPDPNIPVEWEVLLENPDPTAAVTVEFADLVHAGFNGNYLTLICPATLLPPGVDPVNDVDCDVAGASIWIRNILIPPCGRVYLRYQTAVGGAAADKDVCNGGTLRAGSLTSRPQTPLPNQLPSGPDTCIFVAGA